MYNAEYVAQADFRASKNYFYIRHKRTGVIYRFSTLVGPMTFKKNVESWIDSANQALPSPGNT